VHVRLDLPDGGKSFAWEREGRPSLGGLRVEDLPLYGAERLRDLPDGAVVVVTEGEKTAKALRDRGIAAVGTVTGAAGTPGEAALRPLLRLRPILWPDNDATGRAHMQRVAARLRALGVQARIVDWQAAPPKGDAADFQGPDEELRALLDAAAPWEPAEEDGAAVLDEVRDMIVRYVALPRPEAADALTFWIAATHAQPVFDHATRLVVKSPLRRCGKTRLLEVAAALSNNPLLAANISVAALVRSIDEAEPPTLFLDEADAIFAKRRGERSEAAEDLRGIINAGHARGWPYVRWNPQARQREECPTFAMVAIAAIGSLPDTIEDRGVVVTMQRRASSQAVAPLRQRDLPGLRTLRGRLNAWIRAHLDVLRQADPDLPVTDRAADVWAPLVAVADEAGADWPGRARSACLALAGPDEADDVTLSERLLADLREVFGEDERLAAATLIERLKGIEEAPWAEMDGRGLTPHALARLLRPYGVRPKTIRLGDGAGPGFRLVLASRLPSRRLRPRPGGQGPVSRARARAGRDGLAGLALALGADVIKEDET